MTFLRSSVQLGDVSTAVHTHVVDEPIRLRCLTEKFIGSSLVRGVSLKRSRWFCGHKTLELRVCLSETTHTGRGKRNHDRALCRENVSVSTGQGSSLWTCLLLSGP